MGAMKLVVYTANGVFHSPPGCSLIFVTAIGAGAGSNAWASASGGSGAVVTRVPVNVTPDTDIDVFVGVKGIGATAGIANSATAGSASSVEWVRAAGGFPPRDIYAGMGGGAGGGGWKYNSAVPTWGPLGYVGCPKANESGFGPGRYETGSGGGTTCIVADSKRPNGTAGIGCYGGGAVGGCSGFWGGGTGGGNQGAANPDGNYGSGSVNNHLGGPPGPPWTGSGCYTSSGGASSPWATAPAGKNSIGGDYEGEDAGPTDYGCSGGAGTCDVNNSNAGSGGDGAGGLVWIEYMA